MVNAIDQYVKLSFEKVDDGIAVFVRGNVMIYSATSYAVLSL